MARYTVTLAGCDDKTRVDIEASPNEFAFLNRLRDTVNAESNYCCMPKMFVTKAEGEVVDGELGDMEIESSTTTTKAEGK